MNCKCKNCTAATTRIHFALLRHATETTTEKQQNKFNTVKLGTGIKTTTEQKLPLKFTTLLLRIIKENYGKPTTTQIHVFTNLTSATTTTNQQPLTSITFSRGLQQKLQENIDHSNSLLS